MMDVVSLVLNEPVPAKPQKARPKAHAPTLNQYCSQLITMAPYASLHAILAWTQIVAGLEPENTNLFLQMLGSAARVGNGADAVQVGVKATGAMAAARLDNMRGLSH
jgi:hypothetical protein